MDGCNLLEGTSGGSGDGRRGIPVWVCTYLEGGEGLQKSVLGLAGMWREAQRAADIRSHVGRSTGCCRTLCSLGGCVP